jgi:hypothetical protein
VIVAGEWTWLEIAKLVVAALIPVAIFGAGLLVARETRRYEERQWVWRKLFEGRLERWSEVAPLLNDLYCFFACRGHFREIDPPRAIELKRKTDKIVHSHTHLLGPTFMDCYDRFMNTCFAMFTAPREDAKLRASKDLQRAERARWNSAWEPLFVSEDAASKPTDVHNAYHDLLRSISAVA